MREAENSFFFFFFLKVGCRFGLNESNPVLPCAVDDLSKLVA